MKILITGGTGVNGAATARLLVAERMRPVLLDNRMDISLIADIKNDVDLVEGDILDPEGLEKVVTEHGITHIAHLAALMPEPAEADPRLAMRVGVAPRRCMASSLESSGVLSLSRSRKITPSIQPVHSWGRVLHYGNIKLQDLSPFNHAITVGRVQLLQERVNN